MYIHTHTHTHTHAHTERLFPVFFLSMLSDVKSLLSPASRLSEPCFGWNTYFLICDSTPSPISLCVSFCYCCCCCFCYWK